MFKPNKRSPRYYRTHYYDKYTDLGYDYRSHMFERTVSKVILANGNVKNMLLKIEEILAMLVDTVKQVKTTYMISLDKKDRNIN